MKSWIVGGGIAGLATVPTPEIVFESSAGHVLGQASARGVRGATEPPGDETPGPPHAAGAESLRLRRPDGLNARLSGALGMPAFSPGNPYQEVGMTSHQPPDSGLVAVPPVHRAFLACLACALLGVLLGACASGPNAPGTAAFDLPLPVLPLLEGRVDSIGRRTFDLEAIRGEREFRPGLVTPTLGVNGGHLGPTLVARKGEIVSIRVENRLSEPTTLHWHGMELPAVMDGGPHQMVGPGETWTPEWTVDQPAATLWYHPHPHGETERQVYQGMAGFFLVHDDEADALPLPSEYGVDDFPVLIQDISLDENGVLVRRVPWYNQVGPLGTLILINGIVTPHLSVAHEKIRLRLLNASVSRVYNLGFQDDREFGVVASDGGLLAAPIEANRIQLSPGERAEIVVTVEPGDRAVMMSFPQDLGTDFVNHRLAGGTDTFALMELRGMMELEPSPPLPESLANLPDPEPRGASETRRFEVSSRTINDQKMAMRRIDARVRAGSREIWEWKESRFHTIFTSTVCGSACWTWTETRWLPSSPVGRIRSTCRRTGWFDS